MQHRGSSESHQQQASSLESGDSASGGEPHYSIIKASQTSIGPNNSFARSAMRLKQKSSRNGLPNRGGSLDGCS